MKLVSALLVAFLAIGNHASESQPPNFPQQQHQNGPGVGRQGRSFPDFLAPFRGIFGRPRGGVGTAKQLYGVKPSASESNSKPATSPYGLESGDGFRPSFPSSFNDGSASGFGPGGPGGPPPQGGDFGGHYGSHSNPSKSQFGKPSLPLKHRPHPHSPPHHGGPPSHVHFSGPPSGDYQGGPDFNGQDFGGPGGQSPYSNPQHAAQQHQPQAFHTYSPMQTKHHHYFGGAPEGHNQGGPPHSQFNEVSGPNPNGNNFDNSPHHGGAIPHSFHISENEGPQSAQQFSRPALSRPGSGKGGPLGGQQFGGGFDQGAPSGFGDFGGNFGGPSGSDFGGAQPQGSQKSPVGAPGGFFGGSEEYPEQFEEQTRNTREPEIITADNYLQSQGQYSSNGQYDDGQYYPSGHGGPSSSNSNPSQYSFGAGENGSFGPAGPGPQQNNSPIFKGHPLRAGPRPNFQSFGSQEESRRQPFLFRPVSSSIRVPGAVDEDAIYGKPMMMSASNKKPARASIMKFKGIHGGKRSSTFKSSPNHPQPEPFRKPEEIIQLESPQDPTMVRAASYQNPSIMEPDTAASGHGGHGHDFGGGHHGLETANGDRILYHVSGHQGPYSYRYGFDTGKGHKNRQFRFEEKDGKGYVTGKYGFYDHRGKLNVVKYEAHPKDGFKIMK